MPNKKYLQDDSGDQSFLRILLTYIAVLVGYIVFMWSVVFIKEAFTGNQNGYQGLPEILMAVFGTGILGVAGKVFQKREEVRKFITDKPIVPNIFIPPTPEEPVEPVIVEKPIVYEPEMLFRRVFSNHIKTLAFGKLVKGSETLMEFKTIELPWTNNERYISCIFEGDYDAVATTRGSNGNYAIHIDPVLDRSEIMVHTANYVRQLKGCIAPGRKFIDLDNDGIVDVASSQNVMDEMRKYLPIGTRFKIKIVDEWRHVGNVPLEELLKA